MSSTSVGHRPADPSWRFDENVAACFGDMLTRSIPLYAESVALSIEYLRPHLARSSVVLDLGCGVGSKCRRIREAFPQASYVGVDNSQAMVDRASAEVPGERFVVGDLRTIPGDGDEVPAWWAGMPHSIPTRARVDAVLLMWTMQFIPIEERSILLRKIRRLLAGTGAMIVAEKCRGQNALFQSAFDRTYREFKLGRGYSVEDVDRKAESLKNVLCPLSAPENKALIQAEGFSVEEIVGWGPFRVWYCLPK